MALARIAELLAPFLDDAADQQLTAGDLQRISTYIDILQRWNARVNLTAIRDPEDIVTRHFGESLFAARALFPERGFLASAKHESHAECGTAALQSLPRARRGSRVDDDKGNGASAPARTLADIGSGAGFPGIPIKLWRPDLKLTLIESNHKKATFLREVARALTLTDINIRPKRAESVNQEMFDIVTLRAVERFESTLPIAANLVAPGGRLALLIGTAQLAKARSLLAQCPGFKTSSVSMTPIPLSKARALAVLDRCS